MSSDYKDNILPKNDPIGRKLSNADFFSSDWGSWGGDESNHTFESKNTERLKSNIDNTNSKVDAAGTNNVGRLFLPKKLEQKSATDEWSDW